MKSLIVVPFNIKEDASNIAVRNSFLMANALEEKKHKTDVISFASGFKNNSYIDNYILKRNYDNIITMMSSPFFYLDGLKRVIDLGIRNKSRFFWVNGDYEYSIPYKELGSNGIITNFDPVFYKNTKYEKITSKIKMFNINSFVINDTQSDLKKKYRIIYYGRYRPDRKKYFDKYLTNNDIYISTSSKNINKFRMSSGDNNRYIKNLNWELGKETLALFELSLYIEDVTTHTYFNNLANRFYEAINCNTMPIFDRSCLNTIRLSGYDVPEETIIDNYKDVDKISYDKYIIKKYYDQALKEKKEVLSKLTDLFLS